VRVGANPHAIFTETEELYQRIGCAAENPDLVSPITLVKYLRRRNLVQVESTLSEWWDRFGIWI
jgi:hypothetical protein